MWSYNQIYESQTIRPKQKIEKPVIKKLVGT